MKPLISAWREYIVIGELFKRAVKCLNVYIVQMELTSICHEQLLMGGGSIRVLVLSWSDDVDSVGPLQHSSRDSLTYVFRLRVITCHNICFYCNFHQINAVLESIRESRINLPSNCRVKISSKKMQLWSWLFKRLLKRWLERDLSFDQWVGSRSKSSRLWWRQKMAWPVQDNHTGRDQDQQTESETCGHTNN